MTGDSVTRLAEQILDDLSGAAYYADPEILAGILRGHVAAPQDAEGAARGILIELLRRYAGPALAKASKSEEVTAIAGVLEHNGVR